MQDTKQEGGSGTLSSFLHGSAAHSSKPITHNCVIHRCGCPGTKHPQVSSSCHLLHLPRACADFNWHYRRVRAVVLWLVYWFWTLVGIGFIVESKRRSYVKGKSSEIAANGNAVVRDPSAS
ncbi:hypothetical protein SETIT_6G243000v2 [Setaria italica]|uniref:Uncharacterized protein n=1 Tax=Setaria italica TaxID=4555 RepID=A0A368RQB5_SETIT|nr:hypothetical protein SETIT_6G243000v2 [Setaria italica]